MKPEVTRIKVAEACGFTNISDDGLYGHRDDLCGKGSGRCYMGNPTCDLNAAIQLCDVLAGEGWHVEIVNGADKTWECAFWREERPETKDEDLVFCPFLAQTVEKHYHPADALAEAICGAFLRAKGLWTEDTATV